MNAVFQVRMYHVRFELYPVPVAFVYYMESTDKFLTYTVVGDCAGFVTRLSDVVERH